MLKRKPEPLNEDVLPPNIQHIARCPGSSTFECNVCERTESGIIATNRELLMFINWHYSRSPECFDTQPPPIPLDMRRRKRKAKVVEEEPVEESLVGMEVGVTKGTSFTSNNPKKPDGVLGRGGTKKVTEEGDDWVRWKSGSYWIQVRREDVR